MSEEDCPANKLYGIDHDLMVNEHHINTSMHKDGKYEADLLWKFSAPVLTSSYSRAKNGSARLFLDKPPPAKPIV